MALALSPPSASAGWWIQSHCVYPRDGQTDAQILSDRNDRKPLTTDRPAMSYDPASGVVDMQSFASITARRVSACLEERSYTVR
jgi:hypothetical protein